MVVLKFMLVFFLKYKWQISLCLISVLFLWNLSLLRTLDFLIGKEVFELIGRLRGISQIFFDECIQ